MDPTVADLPTDHPGVSDPVYRERRSIIASAAAGAPAGSAPRRIDYTAAEDDTWHTVIESLQPLHAEYAVEAYRDGAAALALPIDQVPQLADVTDRLRQLTGWKVSAVPGLVPTRTFYGSLADRTFLSTQYVRHPSVPFYTPEPDIIHELIGHVNALANPRFAAIYEAAGRASRRATTDVALERFSRLFWFTLEFGVVHENGALRTFGAGLLSSFGEIQQFRTAEIRPFDLEAMATYDYDITRFQDVLFAAESFEQVESELLDSFSAF